MKEEKNAILAKFLEWRYVSNLGVVNFSGFKQSESDFDKDLNKLFLVLKEICKKKHRIDNNTVYATYEIRENYIAIKWATRMGNFDGYESLPTAFSEFSENGVGIKEIYNVCYQFASWWLALKK